MDSAPPVFRYFRHRWAENSFFFIPQTVHCTCTVLSGHSIVWPRTNCNRNDHWCNKSFTKSSWTYHIRNLTKSEWAEIDHDFVIPKMASEQNLDPNISVSNPFRAHKCIMDTKELWYLIVRKTWYNSINLSCAEGFLNIDSSPAPGPISLDIRGYPILERVAKFRLFLQSFFSSKSCFSIKDTIVFSMFFYGIVKFSSFLSLKLALSGCQDPMLISTNDAMLL